MNVDQGKDHRILALVPVGATGSTDPMTSVLVAAAIASRDGACVEAVLVGQAPGDGHAAEAADAGASKVWLCSHAGMPADAGADQFVAAFTQALKRAGLGTQDKQELVLLPVGPLGEEIAARLAVRFDGVALGHCAEIRLHSEGTEAQRVVCGGRALLVMESRQAPCFAAMRAHKPSPASNSNVPAPKERIVRIMLGDVLPARYSASSVEIGKKRRSLEGSKIIVSGGRGMAGDSAFALLEDLADCLDAAVGGSLPAVDAGWVPVSHQVGQSGKYVSPKVYIAVAISGTPQHMAGIDPGTRIVAINSDPEADIFKFAEIGVVGNWSAVLPAVTAHLRKAP
jgi:electron transfer flavoprotein alpha subunit